MTFMNPLLLLGALGISLPIIAHILNKHQFKTTEWAAMQFLNRAVKVRSKQIKLKDLILLILRCLAILLLMLALSRPSLQKSNLTAMVEGENRAAIIIALDTSFSMMHSDGSSTRFERALEEINTICRNINPGDPVSLITLGTEHKVVVRNMAYEEIRFNDILQQQKAKPVLLKMETIPGELSKLAMGIEALQKEIYIVTDMQHNDWKNLSSWMRDALKDLNELANTFILPIRGSEENLSVSNFELFSGVLRKGTTARYTATVRNNDRRPVKDITVQCIMEGINVDSKTIPIIPGKSSQTVSFFVPFHNSGSVKLTAKIRNDALPLDNERRAVANIRERVSILCVEGKSNGTLESFITKALQARGGGSEKEDFRVRSVSWLSLPSQNLKNFDLVILSDVPEITKEQASKLRVFVKEGNGLIWFGGENIKAAQWNKRSAMKEGSFLLPAIITDALKLSDESGAGLTLDPILSNHPICRPLRSLAKDLLSETRFQRVHQIKLHPTSRVVLNLSGSNLPVLVEHNIGRGHVFMFTTSSKPSWNNMALTPVFPMVLQQMVTYLTGREFEKAQLVGSSLSLSYPQRPEVNNGVFEAPSGEVFDVPVRQIGNQYVAMIDKAHETGFYRAKVSLQSPGSPIAVNVDTKESDVSCLSHDEAVKSLKGSGVFISQSTDNLIDEIQNLRTGFEYWRLFMIISLIVLILESFIASNIFSRKEKTSASSNQSPMNAKGVQS